MVDEDEKARLETMAKLLERFAKQCDLCGRAPANAGMVEFQGNIGFIVRRYKHELRAELCSSCPHNQFIKFTLMNILLGWWGTISCFVTPGYILNNFAEYGRAVVRLHQLKRRRAKALADALKATDPKN